MAGQRLTDKTEMVLTPGTGDLLMIVDVNDSTGSAEGTSKKIDNKFLMQTDKITITNAEFKALNSDGRILVSSPGAGFGIIPIDVYIEQTPGASGNNTAMGTTIGHFNKDASYYWSSSRFWPKTSTYDGNVKFFTGDEAASRGQAAVSSIADRGLYIYAKDAAPDATSTNSWVVYVTYRIIDIS
jgi:hypothetical protein